MGTDHASAPCPRGCGRDVTYEVVAYQGRRYPPFPPICPDCAAADRAEEEGRHARALEDEREVRAGTILELLHRAGANPWEHGASTFGTFATAQAGTAPLVAAREFVQRTLRAVDYDPVVGLYLEGPTGTGKTHLLVAIARELLLDPRVATAGVIFDHAASLITEIQDAYSSSSDRSVRDVKRRRIEARVWLLDDLGTERPSDDVARILTEILTLRAMRPTAITSNHAPPELEARHPELWRMGSRLGPAYFERATVLGPDRRHIPPAT